MKIRIEIHTFRKELSEDQKQILRRVGLVLKEHDLDNKIVYKEKKKKLLKLKGGNYGKVQTVKKII